MAKPAIIGDLTFPTKGEAKKFFGDIRHGYPDGTRLGPEDEGLLRALLCCHPEAADKIGAGIAHFSVETDTHYGQTRHFTLHRLDGSSTDFSFIACIDGRNERRDRLGAMRHAVQDQIIGFRDQAFAMTADLRCPLRGVPITRGAYHVDHAPPLSFDVLANDWLAAAHLELNEVLITPPGDKQIIAAMTDPSQLVSWQGHHLRHARLRMLSPRANLSDARRV
jgi:hypothetical protein